MRFRIRLGICRGRVCIFWFELFFNPVKILASFFSSLKEKSCVWSRSTLLLLQLSKTSSVASRHPSLVRQSLSGWIFLRCLTRWESCQSTASKDDVEWHFKQYGNCYCVLFGALFDVTAAARGLCFGESVDSPLNCYFVWRWPSSWTTLTLLWPSLSSWGSWWTWKNSPGRRYRRFHSLLWQTSC